MSNRILQQSYTVSTCHIHFVAIDVYVVGILDFDLSSPQPTKFTEPFGSIANKDVITNNRVLADFMLNAGHGIARYDIVFIKRVDVVGIGPHAWAIIIVRVIVTNHQAVSKDELESSGSPAGIDT